MLVDHTGSQQNHLRTPEEVLVSRSGFEMLQRFAAMIASSDDAIISNTIEGTVTSWNNGAERIFGYAAHEMLGQSISRLVSARGGDDMAKSLDRIRRGEHVDHYEAMRRCKDGREIPVSLTISGLRDSSGEFVGAAQHCARCFRPEGCGNGDTHKRKTGCGRPHGDQPRTQHQ